jgi:Na+-transporting NADH:ubiquinone oxidoreductase subunit NqrE
MDLGPIEIVIIVVLALVLVGLSLALPIWAIVDAAGRPDAVWTAAGQNKVLWIVLIAALTVTCGAGWIVAIVYLAAIRPKLVAAQAGGGYGGGYGPP